MAALAVVAMPQTRSPEAFEVASVKAAGPVPSGKGRGTNPSVEREKAATQASPKVDGSRFSVTTTPCLDYLGLRL
jgi:hypothetical protein